MSIIKLTPTNLQKIKIHFRKFKLDVQNKLTSACKKRNALNLEIARLEEELITCNNGIEWCEEVYKAGKGK